MVDPKKERIALREAKKLNIPIVAITDTNCDPEQIDFVIPGNDDAIRAIKLFTEKVAEACIEGTRLNQERLTAKPEEKPAEKAAKPSDGREGGPKVEVVGRRHREAVAELSEKSDPEKSE